MLWTVFTTREHPPEDLEAFRRMKAAKAGLGAAVTEILHDVRATPQTMRRLAWVQTRLIEHPIPSGERSG